MTSRPDPSGSEASVRWLIGVDGGGTGTRVRLWGREGALLGHGEAGPSALGQGIEQAWKHILEAVAHASADAALPPIAPRHCAIGLGLAGAVAPRLASAFNAAAPPFAVLALETDSRTALLGAHAGGPGAVIALGTGAVGEALHADGRRAVVSGWGFPVGDEGGGAWLGLRAMQAAHLAIDGRAPAGTLAEAVCRHAGATREALLAWCSRAGQRDYAQLAPLVFDCAASDPAAAGMLAASVREIERIAQALDPGCELPLAVMGSIALRLVPSLPASLRTRLVTPAGDAIDGAHRLVRDRLSGVPA